jgi:transcriptional regulator with XRE-family HTH domain
MVTDHIRKGARPHLYIEEWMDSRGLNDERLAGRLGVDRVTVTRWRDPEKQHRLNPPKIAAIAEALDIQPHQLWQPPTRPSLDALLHDASDEVVQRAASVIELTFKTGTR